MHTDHTYDAIVVGARAAGAATAMLLARAGLDVVVVDRGQYGSDTLSTHALMRAGVLQLSRWGLLERIVAAGTPPVRRVAFRYADESLDVPIKPGHGVDALYAPRRTVLDPLLVDAAAEAGASVRYGHSVVDVTRDRRGRVAGVVGLADSGHAFELRARMVIGADGLRSRVAAQVGAAVQRLGSGASASTYGYWRGLDTDGYEWNFRPDAASGVIPTNDGLACVFVGASPEHIGRGGPETFRRIVRASSPELLERLDAAEPATPLRTFTGHRGQVRRSWGRGWALVGDAGYFKDPLSAHGLTDALRDAELLARALVDVADGASAGEALGGYQAQRDALSAALFETVDVIAGHQWTDDEIGGLLRRLSAAMNDEVEALASLGPLPLPPAPRADAVA